MIYFEMDSKEADVISNILSDLKEENTKKIVQRASKRAAVTARKAGTKKIREVYNVKNVAVIHSRVKFSQIDDGINIIVRGPYEPVTKYKASKRKKGVFVSIKKDSGDIIDRSYTLNGQYKMRKEKRGRLPVKNIYGPAVPQLFQNKQVEAEMEKEGIEMYEKRLWHELDRILGGK